MLALNGRESDFDAFKFYLATKLSKSVEEIENLSHAEYVQWQGYFTAFNAIRDMRPAGGGA